DDRRQLALLSWAQFDARSLGLEQAWLEILGSLRHSLVAPFLIRTPESLEAHDLVAQGAKNIEGKTRLNANLESGRSLVSHPRRKAGKGAVKLVHNEKRGAASLKPPPNAYRLAEARMKSVGDVCFSLLFAGSMAPFRTGAAALGDCLCADK